MNAILLLAAWLTPLALAPFALGRRRRWLSAVGALPALAAAGLLPAGAALDLPWLMLGTHLVLNETGQIFLVLSALLWLGAAVFAAAMPERHGGERGGFHLWFLLAMAGNFLLLLAADALTFYLGFALMGLSAFGLVVQRRGQRARRAARAYLVWTLLGELALFGALVVLGTQFESLRFADWSGPAPAAAALLLLVGFGVKLALPGLHWWLPGAYAMAPPAAAAVLSGPMISAGLFGWLRFLPPETSGLMHWGQGLMWVGGAGVALGVLAGIIQRSPGRVLGYSSIAKMGVITAGFGMALAHPGDAAVITTALALFALHHLMVKGSLFLGVGLWERIGARIWLLLGMGLLALALAGAPLTGGAAAKALLSDGLSRAGADLGLLLLGSALGTVLLMARLLWLLTRRAPRLDMLPTPLPASWWVLLPLALWLPFRPDRIPWDTGGLLPLAVGTVVALAALPLARFRLRLPFGGGAPWCTCCLPRRLRRALRGRESKRMLWLPVTGWRSGTEMSLSLPVAGLLWLALLILLFFFLSLPG